MSKAEAVAALNRAITAVFEDATSEAIVALDAIAAWLAAACVVESGHQYGVFDDLPECTCCGQRRTDAPEATR